MNLDKIKRHTRFITLFYFLSLVIIIGLFIAFTIPKNLSPWTNILFFLILIPLFFLSLYFKPKIDHLNRQERLLLLLEEEQFPVKFKQDVYGRHWPQNVLTKGNYLRKEDNDEFLVLYKTDKDPYKPKRKKQRILEVIVIFKKETSSFSDFNLNAIINDLEKEHLLNLKQKRIVVLKFMPVENFHEKTIHKVKDIDYRKVKNAYYLTLNVAINIKSKQALYVDGENAAYIFYYNYLKKLLHKYLH